MFNKKPKRQTRRQEKVQKSQLSNKPKQKIMMGKRRDILITIGDKATEKMEEEEISITAEQKEITKMMNKGDTEITDLTTRRNTNKKILNQFLKTTKILVRLKRHPKPENSRDKK